MATPTSDPVFPPSIDKATPAPEGIATSNPDHNVLSKPLKFNHILFLHIHGYGYH